MVRQVAKKIRGAGAAAWRFVRPLRRAGRLGRRDLLLLGEIAYLLGRVLFLQKRRPLPELVAAFEERPSSTAARLQVDPWRLTWLVDGVLRATFHDRYCMKRSLLLFHFLRKWGYAVRIHFGVVKRGDELTGHAWVELGGYPFAEQRDPDAVYTRTYSYPPSSGAPAPASSGASARVAHPPADPGS